MLCHALIVLESSECDADLDPFPPRCRLRVDLQGAASKGKGFVVALQVVEHHDVNNEEVIARELFREASSEFCEGLRRLRGRVDERERNRGIGTSDARADDKMQNILCSGTPCAPEKLIE